MSYCEGCSARTKQVDNLEQALAAANEQIAKLKEDHDSWRRVAERLEAEKVGLQKSLAVERQQAARDAGRVERMMEQITKLQQENERLKNAAQIGLDEMTLWLKQDECDCDGVCYCGKGRLTRHIQDVTKALKPQPQKET
jgi:chromosome segregation ATPase